MVRLLLICSALLHTPLYANEIYQYKDQYGRPVFSDEPATNGTHEIVTIEIQNDYDWHNPEPKKIQNHKKKYKKKRRKKKKKNYTFAELQQKCTKARYRYQNYRGTKNSSDWGTYKSKVSSYAKKRDYWCSRALKRK